MHHLERSRSERIAWLLEELQLPYEIKFYKRDRRTMLAPAELRAVHSLGKAPVVVDDDGAVLIESGAIIERLLSRHGANSGLRPAEGTPERVAYTTFLHFAEGSMMPPLLMRLIFGGMNSKEPALARPLVRAVTSPVEKLYVGPNIRRTLDFLEGELADRPWIADEYVEHLRRFLPGPRATERAVFAHGDLRPENIMVDLDDQGEYFVTDIIKWQNAGWMPEYWEHGGAIGSVHSPADWEDYVKDFLDIYDQEAELDLEMWGIHGAPY